MRTGLLWIALFAVLFAGEIAAQAKPEQPAAAKRLSQENPGTMKEVVAAAEKSRKESETAQKNLTSKSLVHLTIAIEKSFATAAFSGQTRKIPDEKKGVLELWFAAPGRRAEMLPGYEYEYLIVENKQEYWLPVHKRTIEWMPPEVKKGETVTFEIVWLGGRYTTTGFENVFMINGFHRKPAP